jgi:hypothetical protein
LKGKLFPLKRSEDLFRDTQLGNLNSWVNFLSADEHKLIQDLRSILSHLPAKTLGGPTSSEPEEKGQYFMALKPVSNICWEIKKLGLKAAALTTILFYNYIYSVGRMVNGQKFLMSSFYFT